MNKYKLRVIAGSQNYSEIVTADAVFVIDERLTFVSYENSEAESEEDKVVLIASYPSLIMAIESIEELSKK